MFSFYETIIIVTPVLSEKQVKDLVKEYEELLIMCGGRIIHQEHWGMKKLAYPIKRKKMANYHLYEYSISPKEIANIHLRLRRDDRIIRFLTVKMNKDARNYAEIRRNKKQLEDK
jgi:small subunit ribosomal protein S6